ncbi:MAG: membrane dipeptidase [Firmicutes bacterium]|mgnify:CR=1 FL=1|nr:membrane dipeptidase [Bacillota bacterium]
MSKLLTEHIIGDSHCDTLWWMDRAGYDFKQLNASAHIDLPRLRSGKVGLLFFAVCTAPYSRPGSHLQKSMDYIRYYHQTLEQNREDLLAVESVAHLKQAPHEKKIACLLALEGAEPLEGCPDNLELFFKLGVRALSLTWNKRNMFADGVSEAITGSKLTRAGRQLLEKMSSLGVILDLAHLSPSCFDDALALWPLPPLVSHANSQALCDHPRNLSDEQVKKVAEKGGVIGLTFNAPFISGETVASLDQLVDHFVHLARVVGVPHLAIGSDFDGIRYPVEEIPDASCYGKLIAALYDRGFTSTEIDLIAGENLRRLIGACLNE